MFDWIPIDYYGKVYNYVLALITLLVVIFAYDAKLTSKTNLFNIKILFYTLFGFTLFYIGFRPIHGKFIDMTTYLQIFEQFQNEGNTDSIHTDYFFWYLTYYASKVMTAKYYFFMLACLYVMPLYVVSQKLFKHFAFYSFFLLVASFSFWAYGTNGMRNGIATSIFLLVFAFDKKWIQALILLVAVQFHSSMLIPTAALLIAYFYKNPKHIVYGWLACIPLSLVFGGTIQTLFAGLMEDDRTAYLTEGNVNNDAFSSTGFRWDFVLYSAAAVYAGYHYLIDKKYNDDKYRIIYTTYVIANAFWILVIKANFSNRFAYLSWFLMALVIVYPLAKSQLYKKQYQIIAYISVVYFGFTFLMTIIKS